MTRSLLPALTLLAATVSACTAYDPAAAPGIQSLEEQRQAAVDHLRDVLLKPLSLWQEEAPPSCSSPNFEKAGDNVLGVSGMLTPERSGIDVVIESGGWMLDVTDAAAARGCAAEARRLYDPVIAAYTGNGYSVFRQGSEIGSDDLRNQERQ